MSFDLFELQQKILDRLESVRGEILIVGTFDQVDVTDPALLPVGAQVAFGAFTNVSQVGCATQYDITWSFDLYVDIGRVNLSQKTAAATLFSGALQSLIGWKISPGREVRATEGRESGYDGRVMRISFGFTIPVYSAG